MKGPEISHAIQLSLLVYEIVTETSLIDIFSIACQDLCRLEQLCPADWCRNVAHVWICWCINRIKFATRQYCWHYCIVHVIISGWLCSKWCLNSCLDQKREWGSVVVRTGVSVIAWPIRLRAVNHTQCGVYMCYTPSCPVGWCYNSFDEAQTTCKIEQTYSNKFYFNVGWANSKVES